MVGVVWGWTWGSESSPNGSIPWAGPAPGAGMEPRDGGGVFRAGCLTPEQCVAALGETGPQQHLALSCSPQPCPEQLQHSWESSMAQKRSWRGGLHRERAAGRRCGFLRGGMQLPAWGTPRR